MTDTLSDIRTRRAQIAKLKGELDEEDEELATAEKVVARLEAGHGRANGAHAAPVRRRPAAGNKPTNRDLVLAVLKSSEEPWIETSAQLHEKIKEIHGVDINFNGTLLPMLSDLKKHKVILRDGPKIALASRLKGGAT